MLSVPFLVRLQRLGPMVVVPEVVAEYIAVECGQVLVLSFFLSSFISIVECGSLRIAFLALCSGRDSGGFDILEALNCYLCDNLVDDVSPGGPILRYFPKFEEVKVCLEGNLCKDEFSMQDSGESNGLAAFVFHFFCWVSEELYHHWLARV